MGDRGVRTAVEESGKGPSYLLDGGTSKVDRIKCCSFFNYQYPVVSRTGNAGAVERLIQGADFAMANLETGVLPNPPFHELGFTFTTDPAYLQVSRTLALTSSRTPTTTRKNGGAKALSTAMSTLDELGVLHAGAGVGPEAAARRSITDINGLKVAIIACDAIDAVLLGQARRSRHEQLQGRQRHPDDPRDPRQRRRRSSSSRIGASSTSSPSAYQFDLAREWFDAGADMIIGAHNHFAGGIYDYNGKVAMLSMGNFIFDQTFRQTTQQGLVVETTWNGNKPVQIWVHPLLNVDAQPELRRSRHGRSVGVRRHEVAVKTGLDWGGTVPDFGRPLKK